MRFITGIDNAALIRRSARNLLPNVLRALRDVIDRAPPGAKYLPGPGEDLPRDQERNKLFGHVVEISRAICQVILVASVRITYEVGVIFKNGQFTLKTLLMHLILGVIEQVFQNTLTGFVINHDIHRASTLRGSVLRMAPRVEIETCPVFEKDVQKTFRGNELLKEIAHDFFGWEGAPSIAGERNTELVFQPVDALFHRCSQPIVGGRHRPSSLGLRHAIEFSADAPAL